MRARRAVLCGGCVLLALMAATAGAEVFQCVDAGGRVLLTDAGCPAGYTLNLVVAEPRYSEDDALAWRDDAEERAAQAEAERRAAEAEAAQLRAALDAERQRDGAQQDRIEALDRKLDALLDRPPVYGGAALVPVPALPWCESGAGRPWVDCRPRRDPPKARVYRPDTSEDCGTFGCAPRITHAPWDDERVERDRHNRHDRFDRRR